MPDRFSRALALALFASILVTALMSLSIWQTWWVCCVLFAVSFFRETPSSQNAKKRAFF
jgi:hypothetical protein